MGNATMVDTMVNDALTDAFNQYHMGITAENIAEQWGLTRQQLDEFAAWSLSLIHISRRGLPLRRQV